MLMKEIKLVKQMTEKFEKTFKEMKRKLNESLEACEEHFLNELELMKNFKTKEDVQKFEVLVQKMGQGQLGQCPKDILIMMLKILRDPEVSKMLSEENKRKRQKVVKLFVK